MRPFSQRLPWSAEPNRLSEAVAEKRRTGTALLDLTETNPTKAGFEYPHAGIANAFGAVHTFPYEPDPFGLESARRAVADYYQQRGFAIDTHRIALTASTSEAYGLLFKLLCDAGDEILIPAPSYPLFEHLAALENVRTIPYRLAYDGNWHIDFDHLKELLSERARALVIVNPNNPTGSFLKDGETQRLVDVAAEHKLALISDEVFMDYELGTGGVRTKTLLSEERVLSFSLNGLSKTAGMPQMKLAWITINGPSRERDIVRGRLELLLDTYLSVNAPVQLALNSLLAVGAEMRSQIQNRVRENYAACRAMLRGTPAHVLPVEGGWSAILQLPRIRSEEDWLLQLLAERNVLLQPGFFFDMPGEAYAVASLIVTPDVFRKGVAQLGEFVGRACP